MSLKWYIAFVGVLLLILYLGGIYASYTKQTRRTEVIKRCARTPELHVLVVCDIGEQKQVAACVAHLFDSASCPSALHVYVLESVASIKAEDFLSSELRRCSELAPTYGYYFASQVHLHRTHQSRALIGVRGISHLLETLDTTLRDNVLIMPSKVWTVEGWDVHARKETGIVTWALKTTPAFSVESWYNGSAPFAGFFAFTEDLSFTVLPMARPAPVESLGVSLRYPLLMPYNDARTVFRRAAELLVGEDAALSYLVFLAGSVRHADSILGTVDSTNRVSSPVELTSLRTVLDRYPDKRVKWLDRVSLTNDLSVCGKSAMGMVTDTLGEVIIKWGSKGAYDTEKEAMQYG